MSRGPEQAPHHLSVLEIAEQQRGFLAPALVIQAALAEIQPDGSVFWTYDDETGKPVFFQKEEPVDLEALAPDTYSHRLCEVAFAIRGAMLHIAMDKTASDAAEMVQYDIRSLASSLSAYRHDPAFIDYAASFLRIDEYGALHGPTPPQESPWEWVPKLRAELAYQNAVRKSAEQT